MARTPVAGSKDSKITAFVVTPDMPGFEVVEKRMPKCGVRGTATSRLAFHDMFVPRENMLGPAGQGAQGGADRARFRPHHIRRQLHRRGQVLPRPGHRATLCRGCSFSSRWRDFELVKEKLAYMSAGTFAMESATYQTAALIDSGRDDYMLETAMLKVFSTDVLWRIINDTIQIFGGKAYFSDEPYERMMRDARINMIGEGANDVLRVFIALVGMRDVGLELKGVLEAAKSPLEAISASSAVSPAAGSRPCSRRRRSTSTTRELDADARGSGRLVGAFAAQVERLLRHHQEAILDRQYQLGRIADAAIELYVSACVLNRIDHLLASHERPAGDVAQDLATGRYYLSSADRRIRRSLDDLWSNDDAETTQMADLAFANYKNRNAAAS